MRFRCDWRRNYTADDRSGTIRESPYAEKVLR